MGNSGASKIFAHMSHSAVRREVKPAAGNLAQKHGSPWSLGRGGSNSGSFWQGLGRVLPLPMGLELTHPGRSDSVTGA